MIINNLLFITHKLQMGNTAYNKIMNWDSEKKGPIPDSLYQEYYKSTGIEYNRGCNNKTNYYSNYNSSNNFYGSAYQQVRYGQGNQTNGNSMSVNNSGGWRPVSGMKTVYKN